MRVSEFIKTGGRVEYEKVFTGQLRDDGKIELVEWGSLYPIIISDDLDAIDAAIFGELLRIHHKETLADKFKKYGRLLKIREIIQG